MVSSDRIAILRSLAGLATGLIVTTICLPSAFGADQPHPSQGSAVSQRVEDNAAGWVWSGMSEISDPQMSGGGGHSGGLGTSGAYTFTGTGCQVYCVAAPSAPVDGRLRKMGRVKVLIDGEEKVTVSVALREPEYNYKAYEITGLTAKNHVVEIRAEAGAILFDYINVLSNPVSNPADADEKSPRDGKTIAEGDYRLFPTLAPSKCVDVEGIKEADGTNTILHPLNDGPNQIWHIVSLGKGMYRLSPKNAPQSALTVLGPGYNKNGVPIVGIWAFVGAPNQVWKISSSDGQQFRLSPVSAPDVTLGVEDGTTKDDNRIEVYKFSNPGVQLWWLVPLSKN